MAKSIRDSRIDAIKMIYSYHISNEDISVIASNILLDENDDIALKLFMNTIKSINEIDSYIEDSLVNYSISRLNLVDRCIIELATYEMLNDTLASICIDEALEITKIYSDQGDNKAVAFNNKVLDTIKNKLQK